MIKNSWKQKIIFVAGAASLAVLIQGCGDGKQEAGAGEAGPEAGAPDAGAEAGGADDVTDVEFEEVK